MIIGTYFKIDTNLGTWWESVSVTLQTLYLFKLDDVAVTSCGWFVSISYILRGYLCKVSYFLISIL